MKLSFYIQDNKFPCYEYKAIAHSQGPDYVVLGEHDKSFMDGTVLKVNSVSAH